jgi:ribosomal protein S18 acetylase RimI-like enzyme
VYPSFSSVRACPVAVLHDLFVVNEWRGLGAARLLMDQVEQLARQSGAALVTLETATTNAVAQALYASRGYLPEVGFLRFTKNLA